MVHPTVIYIMIPDGIHNIRQALPNIAQILQRRADQGKKKNQVHPPHHQQVLLQQKSFCRGIQNPNFMECILELKKYSINAEMCSMYGDELHFNFQTIHSCWCSIVASAFQAFVTNKMIICETGTLAIKTFYCELPSVCLWHWLGLYLHIHIRPNPTHIHHGLPAHGAAEMMFPQCTSSTLFMHQMFTFERDDWNLTVVKAFKAERACCIHQ